MKNPLKLGRIIPKSDYRERSGRDIQCTKVLPMGDNWGTMAILHSQTILMAVKRSK